ncbi:CRISPR-associated endonuclease Cas2 [Marichromatium bheemlicum]|uniref:CRISPR-associated endoribonuclease Cas2 n=1 Tax=Marichromatium bheemlicum TaxID=365339 RepID=A0ABX1ICK2_9GAMM|nr:CRISPR-associated endonuclease Cas2 [Marichromatium bheemlicum]NKN34646.1 CRISPR-associated endonuclease Cas2 [Marichromatium bheemlicum]
MARKKLFLLAYDIADDGRRNRVHREATDLGVALQYSVFLIPATVAEIDRFLSVIDGIIDARADDIRVYPLPSRLEVWRYGRQSLPLGTSLIMDEPLAEAVTKLVGTPQLD